MKNIYDREQQASKFLEYEKASKISRGHAPILDPDQNHIGLLNKINLRQLTKNRKTAPN